MHVLEDLPRPWRQLCELHIQNFFRLSRGRDALAQIWHGHSLVGTAIEMGDSEYIFNQVNPPEEVDPLSLTHSQSWLSGQDLGKIECEVPEANDIPSIIQLMMRPAMRAVAVSCFVHRWAGREEAVARNFTAADEQKTYQEKVGDWMEAYGFGGIVSQHMTGLRIVPLLMPAFSKTLDELENLDWSDPHYPFLPLQAPIASEAKSRRPRLESFPDIKRHIDLNGGRYG